MRGYFEWRGGGGADVSSVIGTVDVTSWEGRSEWGLEGEALSTCSA